MKKVLFALMAAVFLPYSLWAQQTVTGTVLDASDNSPIPGASILIKGSTTGTISGVDGGYSIQASSEDILVFSFVGFETQEIPVGNQSVIDINLETDLQQLREVVVVGYTSEAKRDQLGAVSVVSVDELKDVSSPNVLNNLQGRSPGVFVETSGDPTQGTKVRIRGRTTLGNNSPLYIVDGVPIQPFSTNENGADQGSEWDLSFLNPGDIESIQVLKDASSASIYGSRASNGVVIITTRQPKEGRANFDVNYRFSVDSWNRRDQLTNNRERAIVEWQGAVNDGADPNTTGIYNYVWRLDPSLGPGIQGTGVPVLEEIIYPDWLDEADQIRPAGSPNSVYGGNIEEGTDWFDEVAQTGYVHNLDLSFSQATARGGVQLSLNYFDQKGIVINTGYQRIGARINSNYNFFDNRLTVGQNFNIVNGERRLMDSGFGGTPEQGPYRIKSIVPVLTEDGRFAGPTAGGFSDRDNPVGQSNDNRDDRVHNLKALGNIYADLKIIEGLNFKTSFGIDYDNIFTRDLFRTYQRGFLSNTVAELDQRQTHIVNWVFTNVLTYTRTINRHNFTILAGTEAVNNNVNFFSANGRDFALETKEGFQLSAAQGGRTNEGSSTGFSLFSYFGKANYAFDDRYLASFTIRRDGSSRFGSNNQFGTFPAFSLGWRLSEEAFLSGSSWLTDLKLRFAWGQTGNQDILNEARFTLYQAIYAPQSVVLPWGGGCAETVCPDAASAYDIGNADGGTLPSGFVNTQTGNEDLKWETQTEMNFGLDWGMFNQSLTGSFEYFKKETDDILIQPTTIATFGDGANRFVNGASIETKGWEFGLGYEGESNDWSYSFRTNLSHFKDKVTDVPEDLWPTFPGNEEQNIIGQSPNAFFGYRTNGIFQDQADVDRHADQTGKRVGALRFVDLNRDGVITVLDQEYKGVNGLPDAEMGLQGTVRWRNFDLNFFFWGTFGREIAVDVVRAEQSSLINGENGLVNTLDAWSPTNTGSFIPAMSNSLNNFGFSLDYEVRDGDYFAFRQFTFGYSLPAEKLNKIFLSNFRVFLQGENLFWITDSSGSDQFPFTPWRIEQQPATPGLASATDNIDRFTSLYPKPLRFTIGVNVGF